VKHRRVALALGLALAASGALAARPAPPGPLMAAEPGDMAIGNPHARVTVVEYGSVGCPHCAVWANTVFPAFKARYVDTGRVRFVVREMATGEPTLAAAGFITARCAGPGKYFQVIDEVYRRQASMFQPGAQPAAIMADIARNAGLTEAQFNACLDDHTALDALNARVAQHVNVDKVDSTPTFVINGKTYVGELTPDQLTAAIAAARRGR
jgi:protein-disulfide isomerase